MDFEDFFKDAKKEIVIIGVNSLIPFLEANYRFFFNKLMLEEELCLKVYCESDSENFNQSLITDSKSAKNRTSYTALQAHKARVMGTTDFSGLKSDIVSCAEDERVKKDIIERITINQVNLRLPLNVIKADGKFWFNFVGGRAATIDDYFEAKDERMIRDLKDYMSHYIEDEDGRVFLSKPGDELIQLYDRDSVPRGIYPRKAFYSTDFKRYSVWGFVFNRKGELLLHQRSKNTKDNRLLWDKSIGGHVDILDSSTYQTAQRELIEELFLPQAEFTPFLKEDIGEFRNYGDLDFDKRPEVEFKAAFSRLNSNEWVMFRATDRNGNPLTVSRVSYRRVHEDDGRLMIKKTVFISDVYLFIAPAEYMDTCEQMKDLVRLSEKTGSAEDHMLVSVERLRDWIEEEETSGVANEVFTDDLMYINLELRSLMERFSEFIKFVF